MNRSHITWTPGLGGNDILDDCTVVALANSARAACLVQRGFDLAMSWPDVEATFADIARVPRTVTAEKAVLGLDPVDVMNYARRQGVHAGLQAPLLLRSALAVQPTPGHLCQAMQPGAAYFEMALTQDDLATDGAWDIPAGGRVALHQAILWDCDGLQPTDKVMVGTWGRWQTATWRGLQARFVGAWQLDWVIP